MTILRIAQLVGAKYEWAHHVTIGISSGLSKEQIKELENWPESSLFSDEDKTVLQFTEEVVRDSQPSEETFETASKFNQFYRDCPVLSEKNNMLSQSRIALVDATRMVLHNALELLGIPAPEEM